MAVSLVARKAAANAEIAGVERTIRPPVCRNTPSTLPETAACTTNPLLQRPTLASTLNRSTPKSSEKTKVRTGRGGRPLGAEQSGFPERSASSLLPRDPIHRCYCPASRRASRRRGFEFCAHRSYFACSAGPRQITTSGDTAARRGRDDRLICQSSGRRRARLGRRREFPTEPRLTARFAAFDPLNERSPAV
jgi:hypothetical protein